MPGTIHENVKIALLEKLRKILETHGKDTSFAEPEWNIHVDGETKVIDVSFRNLGLVCEVEPSASQKETGFRQLKDYAKKALAITGRNKVYGILAWAEDKRGEQWECEVYEFSITEDDSIVEQKLGGSSTIESVVTSAVEGSIPLSAENFLTLFFSVKEYAKDLANVFKRHYEDPEIKVLYEVYTNALSLIYGRGEVSSEKIEELFITHTLIQMIAIAVLNRIKSEADPGESFTVGDPRILTGVGKDFSVSLPFLEWWYKLYVDKKLSEEEVKFLERLAHEISSRVLAFDWKEKTKDVFRLLYEAFISEEDRRQFGEYYTPPWLVNFVLDKIGDLKNVLVVDPFCGSGTFLDYAFRRKVESGEDPEEAYRQVLGFDINPLAVLLARAELALSFFYHTGRFPELPPQIFYVNSLEALHENSVGLVLISESRSGEPLFLYRVEELTNAFNPVKLRNLATHLKISDLMAFESALNALLERLDNVLREQSRLAAKKVYKEFVRLVCEKSQEVCSFFEALDEESIIGLVEKYGDGVWSIAITSICSIFLLPYWKQEDIRAVYIVSNPPWVPLTEVKGRYGDIIRAKVRELFPSVPSQAYNAGDMASLFLKIWTAYGEKVAFVMPAGVSYDGTLHGAGKLLTYQAVKNNCAMYFVNYDAFEHGVLPTVVIYGIEQNLASEVIPRTHNITKDMERVELVEVKSESYTDHVKDLGFYFDFASEKLAKWLKVDRVYKKGTYIMGLFGGERNSGKEKAASQ